MNVRCAESGIRLAAEMGGKRTLEGSYVMVHALRTEGGVGWQFIERQ